MKDAGGQAKRTNIGIALVTSPRVLFLDEPTSGLDSFTSNEVRPQGPSNGKEPVSSTQQSATGPLSKMKHLNDGFKCLWPYGQA